MDKLKAKELFRLHNVPTPPYYMLDAKDARPTSRRCTARFGFPVIVKPAARSSSLGVSNADDVLELSRAVTLALEYDDVVIVERFVAGDGGRRRHPRRPRARRDRDRPEEGFYDYEAKYTPGMTDYLLPARLPPRAPARRA